MTRQHPIISFRKLPYDIHFEITKHLEYGDIIKLAATNRHLHEVLNPTKILGMQKAIEFITNRDKQLRIIGAELFACIVCLRFLPRQKFLRSTNLYTMLCCERRLCLDCIAISKLQPHLEPVERIDFALTYYFCHNCQGYGTESKRCRGERIVSDTGEAEAEAAMALCMQPRRQRQGVEKLPVWMFAKISSFLEFSDVLNLSQVSRELNDVVKLNECVPLHIRYRFVAEKWFEIVRNKEFDMIDMFPCHICSKIRWKFLFSKEHLKMAQDSPEMSWKMICQNCSWRVNHSPKNPVGIEYRRREKCDICRCVKYRGRTCGGCEELLYVHEVIDWKTLTQEQ